MESVDFDEYSSDYNKLLEEQHKKFGDIGYYSQHKVDLTQFYLGSSFNKVLEFGCGVGRNLDYISSAFVDADIYAYDISIESVKLAQQANGNVTFLDSNKVMQSSEKFDLIFVAGVYHHIVPALREEVTRNLVKHLHEDGYIICFEHNPFNPLTRHMVNTCEFDADAVLLKKSEMNQIFINAGLEIFSSGYTLFVPPKLHKLNFIEPFFKHIPLGGQFYSIAQK